MKKGFTLVELVVLLALFSVVILLAFSFLVGANRNFRRSQENSEMYFQARRVSDAIRDEVRFAKTIDLIDIGDIDITSENLYLYVRPVSDGLGELVLQYKTDETVISAPVVVTPVNFVLAEDLNANRSLSYTITSRVLSVIGNREYSVETTVLLNNIRTGDADSGICIEFTKPSP